MQGAECVFLPQSEAQRGASVALEDWKILFIC